MPTDAPLQILMTRTVRTKSSAQMQMANRNPKRMNFRFKEEQMVDMAYVHGLEKARELVVKLMSENEAAKKTAEKDLRASFYGQYANGVIEHNREVEDLECAREALESVTCLIDYEIGMQYEVDREVV